MIPGSANPLLLGQTGTGDFSIERSLRFNSGDSSYLSRQPSSAGNRQTWTWSGWVKRSALGSATTLFSADVTASSDYLVIRFESDTIRVDCQGDGQGRVQVTTSAVYRDPSAWYHIVVVLDTTQSTAADRCKIYVNSALQTTSNTLSQNKSFAINATVGHEIGRRTDGNDHYFDGYLAEINFVDGSALDPSSFGQTDSDGVWRPIDTAGLTFGTNGFRLKFADNSSDAALGSDSSSNSNTWTVNNLKAAVPGLATANQGFDILTWTGDGNASRTISGLSFTPDFIWSQTRSEGWGSSLLDRVRGVGASGPTLRTFNTAAETSSNLFGGITSLTSDGFTVANGSHGSFPNSYVNKSGQTYVAWCWKAGGAAVSNTDGSVTSQVSANASYGFSIVTWSGTGSNATVGHGLNDKPGLVVVKNRSAAASWAVWTTALSGSQFLGLNTANAAQSSSTYWNSTEPTSSVINVGTDSSANGSSNNMVAYVWSEVAGFSKFGSYSGSSSNVTVNTGFKPRYIIIKSDDTAGQEWIIKDSERGGDRYLEANTSNADAAGRNLTFNDDGFTLAHTNGPTNYTGRTYIYAAFAGKPDGSVIDSLVDSPSNAAEPTDTGAGGEITGNYATLSPLIKGSNVTLSDGNLKGVSGGSGNANRAAYSSVAVPATGAFYCEVTINATNGMVGIIRSDSIKLDNIPGCVPNSAAYYENGNKYLGDCNAASYGASFTIGDIIGIAINNGSLIFYKNGVSQGVAQSGLTGSYLFGFGSYNNNLTFNFGQRSFSYPLSNHKSINTANLPTPTIADGSQYFDTKLYTGNASARSLTMDNSSLSPDFVWIKGRSAGSAHHLFDIIRGPGKRLLSNGTQDDSYNASDSLTSFDSNGFSLGADSTTGCVNNPSGTTYAAWTWDAGSSNTTIAVGGLNSSLYNQSDTWSNYWDSNTYSTTAPHDANLTNNTNSNPYGANTGCTWTHTIAFTTSVKLWVYTTANEEVKVNGTSVIGQNVGTSVTQPTLVDVTSQVTSPVTSIFFSRYTSGGSAYCFGIEIDGKLLIDSGVSITTPSLASTVRANPSAGFSIVKFTNTTSNSSVGHGLNAKPELIIWKKTSGTSHWGVYHGSLGATKHLYLNLTNAAATGSEFWNNTEPTSSVVSTKGEPNSFGSVGDTIMYCFAPVAGYSAMGSYTGNGSSDGPFIHTGFRPAFLMFKRSDSTGDWIIFDNKRNTHEGNYREKVLYPNKSNAEETSANGDTMLFLSNGFKLNNVTFAYWNASGGSYLYLAFASNPFASNGGLAR